MPPTKPYLRSEMQAIYESWDYHLQEKIEGADRIVRRMFQEMGQLGIPRGGYIPFVRQKFGEMIETVAREA